MEKLEKKLKNLNTMLPRLNVMLNKLERARNNPTLYDADDIEAYRNSVIKSFELSFELLWKTLKEYLDQYHGFCIASPKGVIHQCLKQNIISIEETNLLLAMADTRNLTTHGYDRDIAEDISRKIPAFYQAMIKIKAKLK